MKVNGWIVSIYAVGRQRELARIPTLISRDGCFWRKIEGEGKVYGRRKIVCKGLEEILFCTRNIFTLLIEKIHE